jgi:hypothetical protein
VLAAVFGFVISALVFGFWVYAAIEIASLAFGRSLSQEFTPGYVLFAACLVTGALGAKAGVWMLTRRFERRKVIFDWSTGRFEFQTGRQKREARLVDIASLKLIRFSYFSGGSSSIVSFDPVMPAAYFRTWIDVELPDGSLTILEADQSAPDAEAADQQLMPVVIELARALSVPWHLQPFGGKGKEFVVLQVAEHPEGWDVRDNPGPFKLVLGLVCVAVASFLLVAVIINVADLLREGSVISAIFLMGLGLVAGGPGMVIALHVLSQEQLVLSLRELRHGRVLWGIPVWRRRRLPLDEVGAATCVARHGAFILRIETATSPIFFGGDSTDFELVQIAQKLQDWKNKNLPSGVQ